MPTRESSARNLKTGVGIKAQPVKISDPQHIINTPKPHRKTHSVNKNSPSFQRFQHDLKPAVQYHISQHTNPTPLHPPPNPHHPSRRVSLPNPPSPKPQHRPPPPLTPPLNPSHQHVPLPTPRPHPTPPTTIFPNPPHPPPHPPCPNPHNLPRPGRNPLRPPNRPPQPHAQKNILLHHIPRRRLRPHTLPLLPGRRLGGPYPEPDSVGLGRRKTVR